MAWSEPEVMCKKHPHQRQQPGFCLSCLNERLSKLPTLPFSMVNPSHFSASLSSSPAFNSSASSSTCTSPTHRVNQRRNTSSSLNAFMIHGKNGLMRKSKSITYVARRRARNGLDGKKEGFWSKLLRSTSIKTKGVLVRSKTGKDRFEH